MELVHEKTPLMGYGNCNSCTGNIIVEYWFAGLKSEVQKLRQRLRGSFVHVDYKDRYVRAAYMYAYFPFYIEPIYEAIINHTEKIHLSTQQELNVTFIGGGPIPELLGLSKVITQKRNDIEKINSYVLDAVPHWASERRICTEEILRSYWEKEFSIVTKEYDFFQYQMDVPSVIRECDIIVVQNCINDCPQGSVTHIERNIKEIWLSMRKNSIIILLDLNYVTISELITRLQTFFTSNSGRVIKPISSINNHRPNIPFCDHLETKLYEPGVDGLIARRNVNYYSSIVKKD
ncbi:MAG: hypothetical protein V1720_03330 [bacterium]